MKTSYILSCSIVVFIFCGDVHREPWNEGALKHKTITIPHSALYTGLSDHKYEYRLNFKIKTLKKLVSNYCEILFICWTFNFGVFFCG